MCIRDRLSECVDFRQDENSFSDIKLIFTNTFLGYKMAQTERIECLNLLAKAAKVDLYTCLLYTSNGKVTDYYIKRTGICTCRICSGSE